MFLCFNSLKCNSKCIFDIGNWLVDKLWIKSWCVIVDLVIYLKVYVCKEWLFFFICLEIFLIIFGGDI